MSSATFGPAARILLEMGEVPPADRLAWLARRCGDDTALLADVQALVDQMEAPDEVPVLAAAPPDRLLPPGTRLGAFTIREVLGAGSSGVAYIARQATPARDVALKVLRRSLGPAAQRRFELEAEVLARLDHPGIARVYASQGPHDEAPAYIAMELVEGVPATDYAMRHGLSLDASLELLALICDAVHHAHQRGVIHRDIKPGNVLVTADGQPKVLDFGVARIVGAAGYSTTETQVGQMVGTLPYMSPEQVAGDPADIDIRTDVYALGVLAFHVLTGRLPFDFSEMNLTEAVRAICNGATTRLSDMRDDLPQDVATIVSCAMARLRERRYESAAALSDDLRRAASGVPIAADRDSAWRTLRVRLWRSRVVATTAAVGVVVLAWLAGYAAVQRREARETAQALAAQLSRADVERGRLLGRMSNLPVAEALLWQQALAAPDDVPTRWALRELYARYASVWETRAHSREAQTVRLSPDDRLAASGGRDGRVQVLQTRNGQPLHTWDDHPGTEVASVGFAHQGHLVWSAGRDGHVVVRDMASGDVRADWRLPAARLELADLAVTGELLVTTSGDNDGRSSGQLWTASLLGGNARQLHVFGAVAPQGLAGSPDGRSVVVGTDDGRVTRIEMASGAVVWQHAAHDAEVSRLGWSPDGRWLASGGTDRTVRVWDAATGTVVHTLSSGNGTSRSVAFSADSRRIASAGWWRVDVWDVESGRLLRDDIGTSEGWYDARFTTSGQRLALASATGGIRLWDLEPTLALTPSIPTEPRTVSVDTDSAALHAVFGRSDGLVTLLRPGDAPTRVSHGARLNQVAVDGAFGVMATGGGTPMLRLWQLDTDRPVPQTTFDEGEALAVALTRDGSLAAAGETGGRLTVVDVSAGRLRYRMNGEGADLLALRFDAQGQRLFTAYRNGRVVVRDAADGRPLATYEASAAPFALSYHEAAGRLAVGTWSGVIDVWSVASGERLSTLTGHARLVTDLDFLTSDVVCSAGRDGSIRVWDVQTGAELALLRQHTAGGEGIRVIDDGQRLAVAFEDGLSELLDLGALDARIAGHAAAHRDRRSTPP